jgi:hypothetical protein
MAPAASCCGVIGFGSGRGRAGDATVEVGQTRFDLLARLNNPAPCEASRLLATSFVWGCACAAEWMPGDKSAATPSFDGAAGDSV